MNIVALDLSLTATGYATTTTRGVLNPPKGWAGNVRLKWILDRVWTVCENADLVVIEGFAYGAQGRAILDIAGLGTLVRFTLWEAEKVTVDIPPTSLKLFATGKGNAPKDDVLVDAVKQLKYDGANHNVADAMWLLELAMAKYERRDVNEYRRRAIEKIDWPVVKSA